jgi:hypothetical protein
MLSDCGSEQPRAFKVTAAKRQFLARNFWKEDESMTGWSRKGWKGLWACLAVTFSFAAASSYGATTSLLFDRGYTLLPQPRKVTLGNKDFRFGEGWRLQLGGGVSPTDVAVESLKEGLASRFHVFLAAPGGQSAGIKAIRLRIAPGSVTIGEALDRDKGAIAVQAYKIALASDDVSITANAGPGLFYGVETLVQLVRPQGNDLWLPEGDIVDWPDLELREIYWDDAHHLEHFDVLKNAIRQAAFYKINGFAIKLAGHFEYKSAPALVDPYALSPAELRELTEYALHYYVQLIPYLDGPGHVAFILKHPEYAKLREYPESNYEICTTNPDTYQLLFGMYQDLLDATKGAKYFHFGGDEPYYVGLAKNSQCDEATRAQELGSVGKVLAEFYTKAAGYLHDRGRTPMFHGYNPLVPEDIRSLPTYLINSLTFGPKLDPVFKAQGIRQMIQTSTVGWKEFFFPNYYLLPASDHISNSSGGAYESARQEPGDVALMLDTIENTTGRKDAELMGAFVAGWADTGVHPEGMWLGYAAASGAVWHPKAASVPELMNSFYPLFYGPSAINMGRVYQLMSEQAQFWKESWEAVASHARTPIWGDWDRINSPPQPAEDQTLPLPPVPTPELLTLGYDWAPLVGRRLRMAGRFLSENDDLQNLLHENLEKVEFNRYNLALYLCIAQLYRQNLEMLLDLDRINTALKAAEVAAAKADAKRATAALDRALDIAENIRQQRNQAFANATATWYQSWYPRVAEANGRRFLHKADDVKDHLPDRTVDMTYLIYRQLLYPLGDWADGVRTARNKYAEAHQLPGRTERLDWQDTSTKLTTERVGDEEN